MRVLQFKKWVLWGSFVGTAPMTLLAAEDPCSKLADQKSSQSSLFVGFGAGTTQIKADEAAKADLAGRIRQRVKASATATQTNTTAELTSQTTSSVDEVLAGVRTLKRCQNADSYSAVMTLEKSRFLNMLQQKLKFAGDTAQNLSKDLEDSSASAEKVSNTLDRARTHLKQYQANYMSDLNLCKTFDGCAGMKDVDPFVKLGSLIDNHGGKDEYHLVVENDRKSIGKLVKEDVVAALEDEDIKVAENDEGTASLRKVTLSCRSKLGGKIPHSNDRVLSVTCKAVGQVGKSRKFLKEYGCQTLVTSEDVIDKEDFKDQVSSCGKLLKPVK